VADVLTSEAVSFCFGIPITVQRAEGRWTAQADIEADGVNAER
jgi:hypothetical protein